MIAHVFKINLRINICKENKRTFLPLTAANYREKKIIIKLILKNMKDPYR